MWGDNGVDVMLPAVTRFADVHSDVNVYAYGRVDAISQIIWWNITGVATENDIVDEKKKWWDINPLRLLVKWRKSSLVRGITDVKSGLSDWFVTRWNTGALIAGAKRELWVEDTFAALSCWLPRVDLSNPGIIPSDVLFMDVWAEVDTSVKKIVNNTRLGVRYLQWLRWVKMPKIRLLNMWSESYKWDSAYRESFTALGDIYWDQFLWNIESDWLLTDIDHDLIVSGGMLWNVALKWLEGTFQTTTQLIKQKAFSSWWQKLLWAYTGFQIKKWLWRFNPDNRPDGVIHWLNGHVVKIHGWAWEKAVFNGLVKTVDDIENSKLKKTA